MTYEELKDIALCGETSKVQFKQEWTSQKEIAKEMIAFANSHGGKILFGVQDKTGELVGLPYDVIQTISRELGNAANEHVRPTIYIETETLMFDDKRFLICNVAEGKNKPYKNLSGEIWVKQGADKRRVTENSEILSLFQDAGTYQPDAAGVEDAVASDLDNNAVDEYLTRVYSIDMESLGSKAEQMLKNIHILNKNGIPTLAGYLFFGKHPEYNCPTGMVKAVSFYGNSIGGTHYRDTKEIVGNMPQIYDKSMAFLKSNLHNLQEEGASFNTLGQLEISETVLEEVLQNALVHRDLLRSAPIRIFIFDDRVEIISPGALGGGLTVEDIMGGKTYQRNPYMATFATNALHYRGIGSGIVRIMAENDNVTLTNDDSGKEFIVTIRRRLSATPKTAPNEASTNPNGDQTTHQSTQGEDQSTRQSTQDGDQSIHQSTQDGDQSTHQSTQDGDQSTVLAPLSDTVQAIINLICDNPEITYDEIASATGKARSGIAKHIKKLQASGMIRREGPNHGGRWIISQGRQ